MSAPDVFQHVNVDKRVTPAADIAVIVLEKFDPGSEPLPLGPLPRKFDLLAGNIECSHLNAVVAGHVEGQCAPSTAGFDHGFHGPQPKLPANQVELCRLFAFEGGSFV